MMVWSVAVVAILLFGGMGAFAGLAPAACGLAALLVAFVLGKPLTSLLAMALPKDFTGHPLAGWFPESMYFMELVVVLFVFYMIGWGVGFWVRSKIDFWLKHIGTEFQRMTWSYLNHGVGLFIGLVVSTIFILIIATGAYAPGYLSTQTTPNEEGQPWGIRYLNHFCVGMQETGLDKIAARWDRTPRKYFEACDMVGLILNNPSVMYRVKNYAPIYAILDRSEISELLKDDGFNQALQNKAGGWEIFNNGQVLNFMNSGTYTELRELIDLEDFVNYLSTGKTPLFDNYRILGEWELDVNQVILMAKKNKPDITYREMRFLATILDTYFSDAVLRATIDKKLVVREVVSNMADLVDTLSNPAEPKIMPPMPTFTAEQIQQMQQMQQQQGQQMTPAAQQRSAARGGVFSPGRYREALDHNARTQAAMNEVPGAEIQYNDDGSIKVPEAPKIQKTSIKGSWSGDGELYKFTFGDIRMDAIIDGDALMLSTGNVRLYFVRRY
ncbi:MAG: hypothetical protein ACOX2U_01180 [Limisphaerales bacterium]|jgi:hypothetical protein|nr:CvpA family protein [Verrucomicrobiota bacterium]